MCNILSFITLNPRYKKTVLKAYQNSFFISGTATLPVQNGVSCSFNDGSELLSDDIIILS